MSKLNKCLVCAFVVLGLFLTAASVQAGFHVTTEVTASSSFGSADKFIPSNLNDDPTLTAATDMSIIPYTDDGNYYWVCAIGPVLPCTVTLDLGSDVSMTDFVLWNFATTYVADFDRGIKDFTLSFATDLEGTSGFGTSIADTASYTAAMGVNVLAPDTTQSGSYGEVFDFADVTARYLRVNINTHYGDNLFVGANEMRVSGAVVPEPGTIVMLLSGLVGLGLMVWRRK